jgi:subtilisin family serine protease
MIGTRSSRRNRIALAVSAVLALGVVVAMVVALAIPDPTQLQASGTAPTSASTAPADPTSTTTDPMPDPTAAPDPTTTTTSVAPIPDAPRAPDPNVEPTGGQRVTELTVVDFSSGTPAMRVVPVGSVEAADAQAKAASDPSVIVEPNISYVPATADPLRYQQWALDQLHVDSVFTGGVTGNGVKVAVLDTGIVPSHEDLVGQIAGSANFVKGETGSQEHGTGAAGIIAGVNGNGKGGSGVAPGAQILDARVCTPVACQNDAVINGIIWAKNSGANVINLSLGSLTISPSLAAVIEWAVNSGVVVVGAAGNFGCSLQNSDNSNNTNCLKSSRSVAYPGGLPNVIDVAAINSDGTRPSYSGYGTSIDIGAPTGVLAPGQLPDEYFTFAGTSAAAPHVAAVAALIESVAIAHSTTFTPAQVQAILQASTSTYASSLVQLGWTSCSPGCTGSGQTTASQRELGGAGFLSASAAVNLATQMATNAIPSAPTVTPNGANAATVTFSSVSLATNYTVLVDGRPVTSPVVANPASSATVVPINLTGLVSDTQYAISIRATVPGGTIDSAPRLFTSATPPPAAPAVPSSAVLAAGSLTVQIANVPAGVAALTLRASDGSYATACSPGTVVGVTTPFACDFFQLPLFPGSGSLGTASVEYIDNGGRLSPPSSTFTITRAATLSLATPQVIPTPGNGTTNLQWALVSGASQYNFQLQGCGDSRTITAAGVVTYNAGSPTCVPDATGSTCAVIASTTMSCDFTGETNGVALQFFVLAQASGALSQYGFTWSRPEPVPLAAPTVSAGAAIVDPNYTPTKIPVQWTAVPGADGYFLYAADGTTLQLSSGTTSADYFVGTLPAGVTTLGFRVQAAKLSNGVQWTTLGTSLDRLPGPRARVQRTRVVRLRPVGHDGDMFTHRARAVQRQQLRVHDRAAFGRRYGSRLQHDNDDAQFGAGRRAVHRRRPRRRTSRVGPEQLAGQPSLEGLGLDQQCRGRFADHHELLPLGQRGRHLSRHHRHPLHRRHCGEVQWHLLDHIHGRHRLADHCDGSGRGNVRGHHGHRPWRHRHQRDLLHRQQRQRIHHPAAHAGFRHPARADRHPKRAQGQGGRFLHPACPGE